MKELTSLLEGAKSRDKGVVVVLNGEPVKGLTLFGPYPESPETLYFRLLRTVDARPVWTELLGSPSLTARQVAVTVGITDEIPLPASPTVTKLNLTVVSAPWALAALSCFFALFIGFCYLVNKTNVLRETSPPEYTVPIIGGRLDPTKSALTSAAYSLAKMQGAWWFFIVLGSYLLIGVVTWDFYSSISSTAIILLGIGAGTVIGAAIIDASKDTPEQREAQAKKAAELKTRIEQLNDALAFSCLQAKSLDKPPLNPMEDAQHRDLVLHYGPDMPHWLRTVGRPFLIMADVFELAALAGIQPPPTAGSPEALRYSELRNQNTGAVADLCELARLTSLSPPPANGSPDDQRLKQLQSQYAKRPKIPDLVPKESDIALERDVAVSRYRKLTNQSEWWFIDVLSDANGVSFHRFQLFSWTIVLGAVFAVTAYRDLAMPVFDTTLTGLLGLSASTYLGLKIPESTIPK